MKYKKVLIVDDEPEIREYLATIVSNSFRDVILHQAKDGNEALAKAQAERYDVLIIDIRIPHLRGPSVVKHLLRLNPKNNPDKIIFMSGFIDESSTDLFKKSVFLPKPIPKESLIQALSETLSENVIKQEKESINVTIINPFLDGALKVLEMMCGTVPVIKEKKIRLSSELAFSDLSALIPMKSTLFRGSMILAFPSQTYLNVYRAMIGDEITEINHENNDGASELCNQIFGYAKLELNKLGFDIEPALPVVVYGAQHRIKHIIDSSSLVLNFESEFGDFSIEITMKANKPKHRFYK